MDIEEGNTKNGESSINEHEDSMKETIKIREGDEEEEKEEDLVLKIEKTADSKATKQITAKGKNITVPQPFSLATEKRTPREKKSNLQQPNTVLTKSISLRSQKQSPAIKTLKSQVSSLGQDKDQEQTSKEEVQVKVEASKKKDDQADKRKETSVQVKGTKDTKDQQKSEIKNPISRIRPVSANQVKKDRNEGIGSSKPFPNSKAEEGTESKLIRRSTSFKATPLPSFYHRRKASLMIESAEKEEERNQQKDVVVKVLSKQFSKKKMVDISKIDPSEPTKIPTKKTLGQSTPTVCPNKSESQTEIKKLETANKADKGAKGKSAADTIKKIFKGAWKASKNKDRDGKEHLENEGNKLAGVFDP